jgi:hypothetical protein
MTMKESNMMRFGKLAVLLFICLAMFFGCAAPRRGVIIDGVRPAQIDLTQAVALGDDDPFEGIVVDKVQDPHKTRMGNFVRRSLIHALTRLESFKFNTDTVIAVNQPIIQTRIDTFSIETLPPSDGYQTRKGEAAVTFTIISDSGNPLQPTIESSHVVNTKPVGAMLRSRSDIANQMARQICQRFAKKLVPTSEMEFHPFATGGGGVNEGVDAAMKGAWDRAERIWQSAIQKNPDNAAAIFDLGVSMEKKHELKKSCSNYKRALALDPENELYLKACSRIEKKIIAEKFVKKVRKNVKARAASAED